MYMQVWVHLRSGALLRYAGITLLLLIFGAGIYFQFGTQALSYVSRFGRNSEQPLSVSNLPAQQATIISTGEDWQKTLNSLAAPPSNTASSSAEYQPTVTDEIIAAFLKEKIAVQATGGEVDPNKIIREYFKNESYGHSVLYFSEGVLMVDESADPAAYANNLKNIIQQLDTATSQDAFSVLRDFQLSYDVTKLKELSKIVPDLEIALRGIIALKAPPQYAQIHKQTAEHLLNQIQYIRNITNPRGDVIKIAYALSDYASSLDSGAVIGATIMSL